MMKIKQLTRKTVAMLLSFCIFTSSLVLPVTAEDTTPQAEKTYIKGEVTRTINLDEYIVLDLAMGNITITATTYTGYAYVKDTNGNYALSTNAVTEDWTSGKDKFYIIQSTTKKTSTGASGISVSDNLLTLTSVDINEELFINQNDVDQAVKDWDVAASDGYAYRSAVGYYVLIEDGSAVYDVTVDDIWTTNQYQSGSDSSRQMGGGIRISITDYDKRTNGNGGTTNANMQVKLKLAGDNRLASLFYYCDDDVNQRSLVVQDAQIGGTTGSLTVIGDQTKYKYTETFADGKPIYHNNEYFYAQKNNFNSVFGNNTSNPGNAYNMYFQSGIIYVGAGEFENCATIGGGGNGYGEVIIEGGTITAVAHGTGAAIGGGDGFQANPGAGTVIISGGKVYAYNYGSKTYDNVISRFGSGNNRKTVPFVPGTAIGGGGCMTSGTTTMTNVTISGGEIYAWSRGGSAIGSGNCVTGKAGPATVTISGGKVEAISEAYTGATHYWGTDFGVPLSAEYEMDNYNIPVGTAIGGGTSTNNIGGKATVVISNENTEVTAYGIGGGNSTALTGGEADVTVNGGTVNVIGGIGGGNSAQSTGGAAKVTVNGGHITASGIIGGGSSGANGAGGNATLTVTAGYISAGGVGGGNSVGGNGGSATVTVSGGRVSSTADIGGGRSVNGTGGTATVTVDDGTLVSVGIGGGYSEKNGYADGTVIVNGGSLNSSMAAVPKNTAGTLLYLTRISFFLNGDAQKEQPIVPSTLVFDATTSGNYKTESIYTDETGMIYLWLPADAFVTSAKIGENIYSPDPSIEQDRDVDAKDVGAFHSTTYASRYILSVAGSGYYSLFFDEACEKPFSGAVITESGIFTYYLKVREDVTLTPIYSGKDADGNDILSQGTKLTEKIGDLVTDDEGVRYQVYKHTVYVSGDLTVCYAATLNENSVDAKTYYILDLCNGSVSITQTSSGMVIEQNGSVMSVTTGTVYLTSAGYPTSNTLTVNAEGTSLSSHVLEIMADELNMVAKGEAIQIDQYANVSMSFGTHNNIIHSSSSSPIHVAENAVLQINMNETPVKNSQGEVVRTDKDALDIGSENENVALVTGAGTFIMNDNGGFLAIETPTTQGVKQIAVGTYDIIGKNDQFSAELYTGVYSYQVIGFISANQLYAIDAVPGESKFSARGYETAFNGVELTSAQVVQKDAGTVFSFQLKSTGSEKIGSLELKARDEKNSDVSYEIYKLNTSIELPEGITYTLSDDGKTLDVTVAGDYFIYGNVWIHAAEAGKIPYSVYGVDTVYDGNDHYITVAVDTSKFVVYYSTTEITKDTGNLSTENPGIRNVTPAAGTAIYFAIKKRSGSGDTTTYDDVYGAGVIKITPGTNEWTRELTCPHIVIGATPNPSAISKWGNTVTYTFYEDDTESVVYDKNRFATLTDADLPAGKDHFTFYVRATVAADGNNYEEIQSDLIEFHVVQLSAYITQGKKLSEVTANDAVSSGELSLYKTDAFSILYSVESQGNNRLHFSSVLPAGTKLTMIDMTDTTAVYSRYVVTEPNPSAEYTDILLTEFKVMGTDTNCAPKTGPVKYQFIVEYVDLDVTGMKVRLNNSTEFTITTATAVTETINQDITATQSDGMVRVEVPPTLLGPSDKILAFTVKQTAGDTSTALKDVSAVLRNAMGNEFKPEWRSGNAIIFHLGNSAASIPNTAYALELTNLKVGTGYQVDADVRLVSSLEYPYVLQNPTSENHKTVTFTVAAPATLSVTGVVTPSIPAGSSVVSETPAESGANSPRVITKDGTGLLSDLTLTVISSTAVVNLTVYQKNGNAYEKMGDAPVALVMANGSCILTPAMLAGENLTLQDGTYRLTFTTADGSVTCNYNLVVISD